MCVSLLRSFNVAFIECFSCSYPKRNNICPPLSCTSGDVFHQHWAAFLRQNLDLMISSLTPKISRQMSDKCPDIHQAFVFLCCCQRYINAVDSNRLNICGDVRGGFQTGPHSLFWRSNLRPSSRRSVRVSWQTSPSDRADQHSVHQEKLQPKRGWSAILGAELETVLTPQSLLQVVRGQLNLTFTGIFKGPSFPKPAAQKPQSRPSR